MIFKHLNLEAELTPAQQRVAKLLGRGMTYEEAAEELCISRRGVDGHASRIRKQIGGFDRADIVVFAIKTGLVEL